MADIDEDVIPRTVPSVDNSLDPDYDPEDEAQDIRFLATLSGTNTALPKRGEKDFEPNPTKAQRNILNDSRDAMHNALAVERVHLAKSACIGTYLPCSDEWWHDQANETTAPGARCVVVEKFKGGFNKSMGKEDFRNWTWLLPEEALFLIERGSLDIRWPDEGQIELITKTLVEEEANATQLFSGNGISTASHIHANGTEGTKLCVEEKRPASKCSGKKYKYSLHTGEAPMSLQGAYACLIGKSGLTMEKYSVYAGLRRLGYIVQRASTWEVDSSSDHKDSTVSNSYLENSIDNGTEFNSEEIRSHTQENQERTPTTTSSATIPSTSLINRLLSWILRSNTPLQYNTARGPLIRPDVYRSYNDIFYALTLNPTLFTSVDRDPTIHATIHAKSKPRPPFIIDYTILKPSSLSTYRKSSPPNPDFLISVVNVRTTSLPTLSQIGTLLDSLPDDILSKESNRKMEFRLKHGKKNVILGVVDCGVTSYLRVADMAFSELGRVHEEKVRRASKGSGGYRGRGGGARRGGRGGGRS